MRHACDLLLGVVDGLGHVASKLLEYIREAVFLRSGFARSGPALGISSDASVGVETADDAIGFGENLATLFDEGLDGVDKLLFVEVFFGLTLGGVDCLRGVELVDVH